MCYHEHFILQKSEILGNTLYKILVKIYEKENSSWRFLS